MLNQNLVYKHYLYESPICNISTGPVASEFSKKTAIGQAEQDPDLPHSASNVLG